MDKYDPRHGVGFMTSSQSPAHMGWKQVPRNRYHHVPLEVYVNAYQCSHLLNSDPDWHNWTCVMLWQNKRTPEDFVFTYEERSVDWGVYDREFLQDRLLPHPLTVRHPSYISLAKGY